MGRKQLFMAIRQAGSLVWCEGNEISGGSVSNTSKQRERYDRYHQFFQCPVILLGKAGSGFLQPRKIKIKLLSFAQKWKGPKHVYLDPCSGKIAYLPYDKKLLLLFVKTSFAL